VVYDDPVNANETTNAQIANMYDALVQSTKSASPITNQQTQERPQTSSIQEKAKLFIL